MNIKRILVPTDFSAHSETALAYAIELAQRFHAVVRVLHVVENPLAAGAWSSAAYTAEVAGLQMNLVRDAEQRLRRSLPSTRGKQVKLEPEVRIGPAARGITDAARDNRSDLIVMGTMGRTGVSHLLLGSVAERVVRTAPCPVVTIRAEQATAPAARKAVTEHDAYIF